MSLLKNWNPINTIENLLYVAATFFFLNYMVVQPLNKRIDSLQESLVIIAMKDTYSIQNDFEKMRTKDGGSIVMDLNNELNHVSNAPVDTVAFDTVNSKRSFFERLFGGL